MTVPRVYGVEMLWTGDGVRSGQGPGGWEQGLGEEELLSRRGKAGPPVSAEASPGTKCVPPSTQRPHPSSPLVSLQGPF